MTRRARLFLALAILLPATVDAADLTVRDLTSRLYHAERGSPLQLGGLDLRDLDLSGLDFKGATLAASNLFGSDLSRADLSKADLKGARLDRVTIIGTRFDGADLSDTSFLRPSTFSTLAARQDEAPSFAGADLRRARIFGRFNRSSFRGADLCGRHARTIQQDGLHRAHMADGAVRSRPLQRQSLGRRPQLYAAGLRQPARRQPRGAVLRKADLSRADLTGADLTGVDLAEADLDGAILTGTRGLDTALGLATARNVAKAIR